MKKSYYLTIISTLILIVTQVLFTHRSYINYAEDLIFNIEYDTYKALSDELEYRKYGQINVPIVSVPIGQMTKAEFDSITAKNSLPPTPIYNIQKLRNNDVINMNIDVSSQISQDNRYNECKPLNIIILDSLFTTLDRNNLSTNFVLTDNITGEIKQSKQQDTTKYRYKSKIFPIGISDKQTVQVYYDIPLPSFIKASIWNLVVSIVTLILMIVTFVAMIRELQRKHKMLNELQDDINSTVHDLKSPLGSIILSLSVVKGSLPSERQKNLVSRCTTSANQLVKKIDMLLASGMTKSRLNRVQIDSSEIDNICGCIFNDLNILYEKGQQIALNNKVDSKSTLYVDVLHLDSIIRNLVENGVKYSNEGVKVDIEIKNSSDNLIISVADNGWGIDKKYQKSIFKRYFQIPTKDKNRNGFGIGLYLLKRIVKANKGEISVNSTLGKGSLFRVVIPCK